MSLTIGKKLGLIVALLIVLGWLNAALSLRELLQIRDKSHEIVAEPLRVERLLSDWYRNIHTGVRRTGAIAKTSDPAIAEYFADDQAESSRSSAEIQKALDALITGEEPLRIYQEIRARRKVYVDARDEIMALRKSGQTDRAAATFEARFVPASRDYIAKVEELVNLQRRQVDALDVEAQRSARWAVGFLSASVAFSTLISVALSWLLIRSIVRRLHASQVLVQRIATGDLTADIELGATDELGQLLASMRQMQTSLIGLVNTVREGSESVSLASREIAQGNQDLSARTEAQASALEQTAASMDELASTVRQNAENAQQANQLAQSASQVAEEGGAAVGEVVVTMRGIRDSSHRIAEIINVIDGIAFQTNILALNAAVESARAGEQGRGFAVVAGEVRSLAQRSAEAAREIKQLIQDSVARAEQGAAQVDRAGSTMEGVVASIRRVNDIMGEISTASSEQSQGVVQVGEAVNQMDLVTQQNAALVEQMAAAAGSLRSQAQGLVESVSVFRVPSRA